MKKYTVHMTPAASNALAQIFEYIAYELLAPDDTFFDAHMDGNIEAMQLLLNTFFHRNDIIVKEVVTQKSANNLYGRSARFDVIAVDSEKSYLPTPPFIWRRIWPFSKRL